MGNGHFAAESFYPRKDGTFLGPLCSWLAGTQDLAWEWTWCSWVPVARSAPHLPAEPAVMGNRQLKLCSASAAGPSDFSCTFLKQRKLSAPRHVPCVEQSLANFSVPLSEMFD